MQLSKLRQRTLGLANHLKPTRPRICNADGRPNPPDEGSPSSSPRLEAAPAIAGPSASPRDSVPDRELKIYEALTRADNARNSRSLYAADRKSTRLNSS